MRRENPGAGHRHARLQGLIFEELRSLLRDDVSDPALVGVRIRAVVLSVDYRHARVHFTILGTAPTGPHGPITDERARIERAFARATPLLRARLADALDIKRVPDLRFILDGVTSAEEIEEEAPLPPTAAEHGEDPWEEAADSEGPNDDEGSRSE